MREENCGSKEAPHLSGMGPTPNNVEQTRMHKGYSIMRLERIDGHRTKDARILTEPTDVHTMNQMGRAGEWCKSVASAYMRGTITPHISPREMGIGKNVNTMSELTSHARRLCAPEMASQRRGVE